MTVIQDILTGLGDLKTAVEALAVGQLPPGTVAVAQSDLDTIAADVTSLVSAVKAKSGGTVTTTLPPGSTTTGPVPPVTTPPITPPSTPVGP